VNFIFTFHEVNFIFTFHEVNFIFTFEVNFIFNTIFIYLNMRKSS